MSCALLKLKHEGGDITYIKGKQASSVPFKLSVRSPLRGGSRVSRATQEKLSARVEPQLMAMGGLGVGRGASRDLDLCSNAS